MKTARKPLFLLLGLFACSATLNASIVLGVNLLAEGQTALTSTDSAGVVSAANWNNFENAQEGASTTELRALRTFDSTTDLAGTGVLIASGGGTSFEATGTGVTIQIKNAHPSRFIQGVTGTTANATMMSSTGRTDNFSSAAANTVITMTGLGSQFTSQGFDLYVYLGNRGSSSITNDAGFELFLDGASVASQTIIADIAGSSAFDDPGFVLATDSSAGNYVVFSNIMASEFVLDIDGGTGARDYGIAGFQIVAIPELSTVGLLFAGAIALGLLAIRRRSKSV